MRETLSERHNRKYGEKTSCPIPVWNGLLEHRKRIGDALWEFLWCLDKVTQERNGIGSVFGGVPVKLLRIAGDLQSGEHSVRRHLDQLEAGGYIRRRRTPYGFVIEVLNSWKFEVWHSRENVKNGRSLPPKERQKRPVRPSNMADLTVKNGRNKEDAAVDATGNAAATPPASSAWTFLGIEPCGPLSFRQLLESRWASRSGEPPSGVLGETVDAWEAANEERLPRAARFFIALAKIREREKEHAAAATQEESIKTFRPEEIPA
jgi:hypothetical protein